MFKYDTQEQGLPALKILLQIWFLMLGQMPRLVPTQCSSEVHLGNLVNSVKETYKHTNHERQTYKHFWDTGECITRTWQAYLFPLDSIQYYNNTLKSLHISIKITEIKACINNLMQNFSTINHSQIVPRLFNLHLELVTLIFNQILEDTWSSCVFETRKFCNIVNLEEAYLLTIC